MGLMGGDVRAISSECFMSIEPKLGEEPVEMNCETTQITNHSKRPGIDMNQVSVFARAVLKPGLVPRGVAWRILRNTKEQGLRSGGFHQPVGWPNTALLGYPAISLPG